MDIETPTQCPTPRCRPSGRPKIADTCCFGAQLHASIEGLASWADTYLLHTSITVWTCALTIPDPHTITLHRLDRIAIMRVSTALTLLAAAAVAVVLPGALAFVPPAAVGSARRAQQEVRRYAMLVHVWVRSTDRRIVTQAHQSNQSLHFFTPVHTGRHRGAGARRPRRGLAALLLAHGRVLPRGPGGGRGQDPGAGQHEQGRLLRGMDGAGLVGVWGGRPWGRPNATCTLGSADFVSMCAGDAFHEGHEALPAVRLLQHGRLHPPVRGVRFGPTHVGIN